MAQGLGVCLLPQGIGAAQGRIPGDLAGGWWRELSPWSLGHWIPESLRHRTKETQGTKGSAEDPSAV